MLVKTVLVTGANRGLGLELVRQFLSASTPPEHLVATYRDPKTSQDLLKLAKTSSSLHAIQLDVTDSEAFPDLVSQLEKLVGNSGLNLLINNAGFKESELRDLDSVTEELMVKHFKVNCVAPLLLTRALLPLLKRAASLESSKAMGVEKAAIIQISSIAGSVGEVSEPWAGMYAYRCSKAALNMVSANLAVELNSEGILVTSFHPGWVSTDMGGQEAPITPKDSVTAMLATMKQLSEKDQGAFMHQDKQPLAW